MTQTMECPEARVSLGVYVLGAIDPAERALVEGHLATCRDCRDELAGLARCRPCSPGSRRKRRSRSPPATAAPAGRPGGQEAPPELLATVIDLTAARRRRRRWRTRASAWPRR